MRNVTVSSVEKISISISEYINSSSCYSPTINPVPEGKPLDLPKTKITPFILKLWYHHVCFILMKDANDIIDNREKQ